MSLAASANISYSQPYPQNKQKHISDTITLLQSAINQQSNKETIFALNTSIKALIALSNMEPIDREIISFLLQHLNNVYLGLLKADRPNAKNYINHIYHTMEEIFRQYPESQMQIIDLLMNKNNALLIRNNQLENECNKITEVIKASQQQITALQQQIIALQQQVIALQQQTPISSFYSPLTPNHAPMFHQEIRPSIDKENIDPTNLTDKFLEFGKQRAISLEHKPINHTSIIESPLNVPPKPKNYAIQVTSASDSEIVNKTRIA